MQKYTEFSPYENHTNSGFVKVNRKLENDEFLSYTNDQTGSLFIISNFGGDEYECTGSCFCSEMEEKSERRSTSIFSLNKGLFVLLTAVSAHLAIQMAEEAFQNECVQKFSKICDSDDIGTEVGECKIPSEGVFDKDEPYAAQPDIDIKDFEKKVSYNCWGHCIGNELFDPNVFIIPGGEYKVDKDKCKKYEKRETVEYLIDESVYGTSTPEILRNTAIAEFIQKNLHPYCLSVSQMMYVGMWTGDTEHSEETLSKLNEKLINIMDKARGDEEEFSYYSRVYPCLGDKLDYDIKEEIVMKHVECIRVG